MIQDAKEYEIVCEINYFLSRLEIKEKLIFETIVKLAVKFNFSV